MTDVVVVSRNDLARLVTEAVTDALKVTARPLPAPLLDRKQCAEWLQVDVRTIDKLRGKGMPHLLVGDVPRFEVDAVREWLRVQQPSDIAGASARDPAEKPPGPRNSSKAAGTAHRDQLVTVRNHSGQQTASESGAI